MKNKNNWLFLIFIGISIIFIYPLLYNNFFITDDFTWIHFAREVSLKNVLKINYGHLYNPVINIYFYLTQKIFGLSHQLYYLFNIIIHGFNAFLIYKIAKGFLREKLSAFLLGLFFLFQYYGAEAFFWISSATHLLGVTFILLSLIFLRQYIKTDSNKTLLYYYIFTTIALITKEIAFPLIIINVAWYFLLKKYYNEKINISKIFKELSSEASELSSLKFNYFQFFKIFSPLVITWVLYGFVQYTILSQTETLTYYFNPSILKQISTILTSTPNLVLYLDGKYSALQIVLTLIIFLTPLLYFKNKNFLIYLFGLFWLGIYASIGSLTANSLQTTLIPNRYGYIMIISLIFIFISIFKNFKHQRKVCHVLFTTIILLTIYNYQGIIKTDKIRYQQISDISKKVTQTLPKNIEAYENIYILDGYPYDHSIYLNDIFSVLYNIKQNQIHHIYTDKRNDQKIDENSNYLILKFDYMDQIWQQVKNSTT